MAKSNAYLLVLLGGVLGIISVISPVAYYNRNELLQSFIWMWGLYSYKWWLSSETTYQFTEETDMVTWGLIGTLIVILASILLLYTAIKSSKGSGSNKGIWILCGILIIAAPIIYYVGVMNSYPDWVTDAFWQNYGIHFGFIGPFIAGGLAILSGFVK